jgi:hypothetical protein
MSDSAIAFDSQYDWEIASSFPARTKNGIIAVTRSASVAEPEPLEILSLMEFETIVAGKKLVDQPISLGIAAIVVVAIFGAFAWGFSLLHGDLGDIRVDLRTQISDVRSDLRSLNDAVRSQSSEQAITNKKLDDLVAATYAKESKR